jgi:hypothetical protein
MTSEAGEARGRIFRLIKNSLILGFVLIFLSFLRPELVSLIDYAALGVSGDLILNIVELLFVVYFGYLILADLKHSMAIMRVSTFASFVVSLYLLAAGFALKRWHSDSSTQNWTGK